MNRNDETSISEISILRDGRIYVFGLSRQLLEVLDALGCEEDTAHERLERLRALDGEQPQTAADAQPCAERVPCGAALPLSREETRT